MDSTKSKQMNVWVNSQHGWKLGNAQVVEEEGKFFLQPIDNTQPARAVFITWASYDPGIAFKGYAGEYNPHAGSWTKLPVRSHQDGEGFAHSFYISGTALPLEARSVCIAFPYDFDEPLDELAAWLHFEGDYCAIEDYDELAANHRLVAAVGDNQFQHCNTPALPLRRLEQVVEADNVQPAWFKYSNGPHCYGFGPVNPYEAGTIRFVGSDGVEYLGSYTAATAEGYRGNKAWKFTPELPRCVEVYA